MGLSNSLVEPVDLGLHGVQLRDNRLAGKECVTRQPFFAALRRGRNQLLQSFTPLRCHQPELCLPPTYVKAYVKRGKNDAADAAAICEAVTRPSMHFVQATQGRQQ